VQILHKNRITVQFAETSLHLDPKTFTSEKDLFFISHTHYDHLPLKSRKPLFTPRVVCSKATARLFGYRMGYEIAQMNALETEQFSLKITPSGHTFDSSVAEIIFKETNQRLIYTGDINLEDRAYLQGFRPKKCDLLLLEATWGNKDYAFPPFQEQVEQAKSYIQAQLDHGYPVILLGYPIGKAQLLNYCFGGLSDLRFSSNAIWEIEQVHRDLGLALNETEKLPQTIDDLPKDSPWLLFHGFGGTNAQFFQKLRRRANCRVIAFSGWAKNLESFKYRSGVDAAFTISDHSDYNSLVRLVYESKPEKVFTVFGEATKLARDLQKEGINATPLTPGQATLDNFL